MRLRVGVVGLGRLWDSRHKPALARLGDRFQITAVYDQVAWRAEVEAETVGGTATVSLVEMMERPDIDVIYCLAPQWFGSHAAELAADAGKPIYWGLPVAADPDGLEAIAQSCRTRGTLFVPEMARRFYPATLRLRELLETVLGAPRLILGHVRLFGYDRYSTPGPSTQLSPVPLAVDPGGNLVDWCRFLFRAEPAAIDGFGTVVLPDAGLGPAFGDDFEGFTLSFSDGALAQFTFGRFHRGAWDEATRFLPRPGFQVYAERGAAWLEMPDHIQWTDASGQHEERLPLDPAIGEVLNDHFHRLVTGRDSLAPTLDDALAAARAVRLFQKSRAEGRRFEMDVS